MQAEAKNEKHKLTVPQKLLYIFGVICCLYVFLVGLSMMGSAFKVLGGKGAGNLFAFVRDPIIGLMIGILATVLVQSSSTSTSIVVGLVSADLMDVQTAIPVIMGANIGTSVTSTLVSLGQMNNKAEFERAFAGATVHDMFNYLAVCVLLPVEIITSLFSGGNGGMLYWISWGLTSGLQGEAGGTFTSPTKAMTSPVVKAFISVDKDKIKALSLGPPVLTTCLGKPDDPKMYGDVSYTVCGNQTQLEISTALYQSDIVEGSLVKGGVFEGTPDGLSGTLSLIISLIFLCGALYGIVKCLKKLVLSGNQDLWGRVLNMNGYLAILVGALLTISVQSSSIITSTLVPLVGLGTLTLEGMLPLTLGANIGTTCTALLAAVASGKVNGLQIALCHLCFNILGIMCFYPVPYTRRIPINAARKLGYMTICYKAFPFVYIGVAFFFMPLLILGLSEMMHAGTGGLVIGVLLCLLIAAASIGFIYMYKFKGWDQSIKAHLAKKYEEREVDEKQKVTPLDEITSEHSPSPSENKYEPNGVAKDPVPAPQPQAEPAPAPAPKPAALGELPPI